MELTTITRTKFTMSNLCPSDLDFGYKKTPATFDVTSVCI